MNEVYAHLGGSKGRPHRLIDHLRDVAEAARTLAREATPEDQHFSQLAYCAGWLHDLGKFRDPFQRHLRGTWTGDEKEKRHAVYGAAAAALKMPSVAFAILGHHAGLNELEIR